MMPISLLRQLFTGALLAALLTSMAVLPAGAMPAIWERRKGNPEPADERFRPRHGCRDEVERGDGAPEPFKIKPRPTPKAPAAYKPQPKPQPKPRPGAQATPVPGAPAPTPPITRPT